MGYMGVEVKSGTKSWTTFEKDEIFRKEYKEYLKNEYRGKDKISKLQT